MELVTLNKLSKGYKTPSEFLPVLGAIDLQINVGDFCVLSGPSGSGKSTLLNMFGILDAPDSGEIHIDGVNLSKLRDAEAAHLRNSKIGFIFQSFHLIPVLTAAENVAYPLFIQGVSKRQRMKRAYDLLAKVGLAEHARRIPAKLSGGQCQRVAIARALACKPKMILADEPTANLDRKSAADILNILVQLNHDEQVTMFIATHDPLVHGYAARHLTLNSGAIAEQQKPEEANV